MENRDETAVLAQQDSQLLEGFIQQHEFFILRCASDYTGRYIRKSDDEWSVALIGFSQAVSSYSHSRGSFLSFARMVIQRRLIDYSRSQNKYKKEFAVCPADFELIHDDEENHSLQLQIARKVAVIQDDSLKLEIEAASLLFADYGFSFYDLSACSPKADKTKKACALAVCAIVMNAHIFHELRTTKMMPIKNIIEICGVSRKIIERHRKYIIAAAEIMTGDYPCLAEYMRFIREELNR